MIVCSLRNVHPSNWVNPEPSGRYNIVVLGAGTAGLITAVIAASLGAKLALIEKLLMGGNCLNPSAGCRSSGSRGGPGEGQRLATVQPLVTGREHRTGVLVVHRERDVDRHPAYRRRSLSESGEVDGHDVRHGDAGEVAHAFAMPRGPPSAWGPVDLAALPAHLSRARSSMVAMCVVGFTPTR